MVCIEDLRVRNMSKSAAGSTETPGKQVRAKAGLNRAILDQGWFEFRRQLQYKLSWQGGELILVPPRNTSRRCPQCAAVSAQNRPTQARFACIACGFEAHADLVGAINILRAGHARCACEVSEADRQQQEPVHGRPPYAKRSSTSGSQVMIAAIHPACVCDAKSRALMEYAG
jgi:putative transposase